MRQKKIYGSAPILIDGQRMQVATLVGGVGGAIRWIDRRVEDAGAYLATRVVCRCGAPLASDERLCDSCMDAEAEDIWFSGGHSAE